MPESLTDLEQQRAAVLRQMKASGKGIIGMKILGAGKLRDKADECLQFALALDCLDCMTIGSEMPESDGEITTQRPQNKYSAPTTPRTRITALNVTQNVSRSSMMTRA